MSNKAPAKAGGKQDTRWKPGQSGNPAGKLAGTRHKATMAAQALLDGEAEGLTRKAIDLAMSGDTVALRLCIERLCPPRKSRPVHLALPEAKTAEGVAEAQAVVVQAVADGEITPEEGTILAGILEARRKAVETLDHEERIASLEKENKANGRKR